MTETERARSKLEMLLDRWEREPSVLLFGAGAHNCGQVAGWVRAALLRPQEGSAGEWRPIETAPKDGIGILASWSERCAQCGPDATGRAVVRWKDNGWYMGYSRNAQAALFPAHTPTHWMPLPPSPTPKASGEKM